MKLIFILLAIAAVFLAAATYLGRPEGYSYSAPAQAVASSAPAAPMVAVKPVVVHYRAVLVAGDASIPNFDNATDVLARRLERSGDDVRVLTSNGNLVNQSRWYAASWTIYDAFYDVKPNARTVMNTGW